MAYDKLRPSRQQLDGASKLARSMPSAFPAAARNPSAQFTSRPPQQSTVAPMKMARDPLYRVERRIYSWYSDITRWFTSLDEAQTYVFGVRDELREQFSRADWPLSFRQTEERGAWYLGGIITIPIPVQQMALLHELAHHLVGVEQEHNKPFLDVYFSLVRSEIGEDVADRMMTEMNT